MTKTATTPTALGKAQAELERLERSRDRAYAQLKSLEADVTKARRTVQLEQVKMLVGQRVKVYFLRPAEHRNRWLNDAIGTLVSVGRKYGVVDYHERGEWKIPLMDIVADYALQDGRMIWI